MSKIRLSLETGEVPTPPAGKSFFYFKEDGTPCYKGSSGEERPLESVSEALVEHNSAPDPHPQYLSELDADLIYAEIDHLHNTGNLLIVSKTPEKGQYSSITDAISYAVSQVPSSTKKFLIKVGPGEYTEAPFTVPGHVHICGLDQWNSAVIKTSDLTNDFITLSSNGALFNIAVSGPTSPGKSSIKQVSSGITKLYWVNIKEGSYGVTLDPSSGTARCHCIGVVTDGPTQMNRMFNIDNPVGVGVFLLIQSGPMSTTWVGTQPSALYLNGNGTLNKVNATLDLCQFRGVGFDAVYGDNAALVRGICCSFSGGTNAIHIGPNGGSKFDIHGSQIKPGSYTNKDIWCESTTASVSFSGVATESKLSFAPGSLFIGSFADVDSSIGGQVIYGELWIGNTNVKTPLSSYIQANKNTGVVSGGSLSRGAGEREVIVSSGIAFLDTPYGLKEVNWSDTTLTIPSNSEKVAIYVNSDSVLNYSLTPINSEINAVLGHVGTSNSSVIYIFDDLVLLPQFVPRIHDYLERVIGPINISGGLVTPIGLGFSISASTYFFTETEKTTADVPSASFYEWYRNGSGGWTVTSGNTQIQSNLYDDGSGTLAIMEDGKWRRDNIFICSHGQGAVDVHVIIGQTQFDSEGLASLNPLVPDSISEHTCRVAASVILKGATSFTSVDQRPRLGQMSVGASSITSHNDLTGRGALNAHSQYQLTSEKGTAGGYCELGTDLLVPLNRIPPIPHGSLSGGALHSTATSSSPGFMSAGDKEKLDGVSVNATANSSDSDLLDRSNHTGVQGIATITGLQTELDNRIVGIRQGAVLSAPVVIETNSLTDVSELSVSVVAGTYIVDVVITYRSSTTGTGIAFSLNGPPTSSMSMRKIIPTSTTSAIIQTSNSFATLQTSASTPTANADNFAELKALITFTAPGTLVFRSASESNGQSVTIREGTTMFVEKVA